MNFIALSIKTANQWPDSICAIHLTKVINSELVDSLTTYIKTTQDFDPFHSSIHGIESVDIVNSPTFDEFYPILQSWLQQQTIVSFHEPFESLCLQESFDSIGQLAPTFEHYSLLPFLKQQLPKEKSYALHDISAQLKKVDFFSDAERIANLTVSLIANKENWTALLKQNLVKVSEPVVSLAGKTIVFTGGLAGLRRSDAAKIAMRTGAFFSNSITKKTSILVISQSSEDRYKDTNHQSSKWRQALSLQQQGFDIHILTESKFLQLINH